MWWPWGVLTSKWLKSSCFMGFSELHSPQLVHQDATQDGCGGNLRLAPLEALSWNHVWTMTMDASQNLYKSIQVYCSGTTNKVEYIEFSQIFWWHWPFIQRAPSFLTSLDKLLRNKCVKLCWIPVLPVHWYVNEWFCWSSKAVRVFWFIWGLEAVTTPPTPVVPTIVARTCNRKPLMLLVDE